MKAPKDQIASGTATIPEFFYWINERHRIWVRRQAGAPKPWTDDPILRDWKFTNAFRQLDRGTVALHYMLEQVGKVPADLTVFNIMWYRLFNLDTHALENGVGFTFDEETKHMMYRELRRLAGSGQKVFTSAHMTTGVAGEPKVESYIRACEHAWANREHIVAQCKAGTMEQVFNALLPGYMIGRFVAYEIVCDLRFVASLWPGGKPTDVTTWANMGPGAARGLTRLGLLPELKFTAQKRGVELMRDLYRESAAHLEPWVLSAPVPFELREIEHSLCEFDKYQRVKRGEGQPRMKFNGRA